MNQRDSHQRNLHRKASLRHWSKRQHCVMQAEFHLPHLHPKLQLQRKSRKKCGYWTSSSTFIVLRSCVVPQEIFVPEGQPLQIGSRNKNIRMWRGVKFAIENITSNSLKQTYVGVEPRACLQRTSICAHSDVVSLDVSCARRWRGLLKRNVPKLCGIKYKQIKMIWSCHTEPPRAAVISNAN